MKVLNNRVLVKEIVEENVSAGGIIIESKATINDVIKATIVSIGPGKYEGKNLVKPDLELGDTVLFSKRDSIPVSDGKEDYIVLQVESILCVLS